MANTKWQLSGNMAERYEEHLVPVVFTPWAHELIARAGLGQGERLLDLACGTGIVARVAAQKGILATGSDLNEAMLAVATEKADGADISFTVADAQDLPFEDESFDAVICSQGLQFFPDKARAASECLRVLRRGGRAVFSTARGIDENPLMQAQVSAISDRFGAETAGAIRAVCGFATVAENRALFEAAGFTPVSIEPVKLELLAEDGEAFAAGLMQATPVADRMASLDDRGRAAMQRALLAGFGDHYDGASLRFPHSANVVVATRPV